MHFLLVLTPADEPLDAPEEGAGLGVEVPQAFLEGAVLFGALWWFSRKPRPLMAVSGLFLLLYGTFRIIIEFVRIPDEGRYLAYGWITKGQVLSVPMVVAGLALVVLAYTRGMRGTTPPSSPVDVAAAQKAGSPADGQA